jgi:hypothetical protein
MPGASVNAQARVFGTKLLAHHVTVGAVLATNTGTIEKALSKRSAVSAGTGGEWQYLSLFQTARAMTILGKKIFAAAGDPKKGAVPAVSPQLSNDNYRETVAAQKEKILPTSAVPAEAATWLQGMDSKKAAVSKRAWAYAAEWVARMGATVVILASTVLTLQTARDPGEGAQPLAAAEHAWRC